ncbi:uroporphyrinogen-III C-methyltransferase [Pseudomonadota bacterium]
MTDSNDKDKAQEADVTLSEFSNEIEETTAEITATPATSGASSPLPLVLSIMAVAGVILLAGGGYWFANEQKRLLAEQQSTFQDQLTKSGTDRGELRTKVDAISSGLAGSKKDLGAHKDVLAAQKVTFEEQQQKFEAENKRLQQREAELQATLEDVQRSIGRTGSQWMAAEAEYLIRVANHRLRLERDEKTALSALRAADGRLKATGDPLWTEVREALAGEMSALLTLVKLDTIGKAATLSSMVKQVDKLRLIDAKAPEIHVKTKTSEALNLDDVIAKAQELLAQGWLGFKSLVIVRRHDAPVTAMMPPEHRYFIYQNLRMQLEAARFAILRADAELYKSSLTTVSEWMNEFVVKDDPAAQAISEELDGLVKANIRPELPDISGSLRLLREKMKVVGLEAPAS